MKKIFLNEAEKQKIIAEKEKAIMESFAKTYNKIKRVDESNLEASLEKSIMKGMKTSVKEMDGYDNENAKFKIGDSIENAGNDGVFFNMSSDSEQYVEFPGELSGEIVDIKNGFYILKGEYKGNPMGMIKVKISDPYYRKKRLVDNEGNVHVESYNELMYELRRNYDLSNVSYTGNEGENMYFWLEPSETMIGQFDSAKNNIWFKPQNN
jgi:hypothetical protein